MTLQAPPTNEPIAVPDDRRHPLASKLPKLMVNLEWLKYFGGQSGEIDEKTARKAKANLSGQTASVGTTPFPLGSIAPGIWRISYTARITTPATTSSSLTVTITWTDGGVTMTQTGAAITGNTTATGQSGSVVIRVDASTPISYSTTYASVGGMPMAHALDLVCELLAAD